MKKKQFIGLGTFLLVLLLCLFTTSYANDYRDFTETEIKNILYKAWLLAGNSESDVINAIDYHDNQGNITTIVNALNNTNNCIISFDTGSSGYNFCYISCYNSLSNTHPYFYNGRISFKNRPSGTMYKIFFNHSYSTDSVYYYYNSRTDYIYYGDTFYNSGSGTTVTHAANTYTPSTFFDGPYEDVPLTYFEFDMEEYASTQYVNVTFRGTTYNNVPVYYKPTDTSQVFIGTLLNTEPSTLKEDFYGLIYWDGSSWVTADIQQRNLSTFVYSSPYLSINSNSDMTEYRYGQQPRFAPRDCFYFYSIDDVDYNRAYALWYIGSSKTVISGDQIDPTTFDDYPDYDDNVKKVLDNIDDIDNIVAGTEPIVDTLTNDEDVSGDLAAFISGDADDLAAKFGYNPIENPFTTVVLDIVQQLTDVLLGSGNATIDLSNHGLNWVINSRDIYLPSGRITTFIHLMCNAWFIWGIYKYGFQLYQWIQSGRLQNLVNETNRHQYFLF